MRGRALHNGQLVTVLEVAWDCQHPARQSTFPAFLCLACCSFTSHPLLLLPLPPSGTPTPTPRLRSA
ncbi:hypothetical protein E2C01_063030 [Portunus trituberculatus]|uniref:Uncharacterized protein n=1 Tax=Portunus trituberculatus TaxID=210409 RepID=A0A5B7H9F2_PORTR|nr:hypothetical protein [Portunus trituberculatus]